MKMFVVSKKLLSTAFGVAALAVASLTPAFAQSRSQYGSPLPRYYDAEGARVWGSWAPPPRVSRQRYRRTLFICTPNGTRLAPDSTENADRILCPFRMVIERSNVGFAWSGRRFCAAQQ